MKIFSIFQFVYKKKKFVKKNLTGGSRYYFFRREKILNIIKDKYLLSVWGDFKFQNVSQAGGALKVKRNVKKLKVREGEGEGGRKKSGGKGRERETESESKEEKDEEKFKFWIFKNGFRRGFNLFDRKKRGASNAGSEGI